MTTTLREVRRSAALAGRLAPLVSPESRQLIALGRQQSWDFAVLGRAPMPNGTVHLGDWLMAPVHQDSSAIPARAVERVQAIYAAGLRPRGFVVVHEVPKLLTAPTRQKPGKLPLSVFSPQTKSLVTLAAGALGALAVGAVVVVGLAILAVFLFMAAAVLLLPAILVAGVATADPILVAVTEDGHWIEIDRWDVEAP